MARLEDHAAVKLVRLYTTGRKSGRERAADVWFVLDGSALLVQAGPRGQKGWYANLRAEPRVKLQLGGSELKGVAEPVTDPAEQARVAALFRRKYWLARAARWFGSRIGRGKPVRIVVASPRG